jgi:hypothetical protein
MRYVQTTDTHRHRREAAQRLPLKQVVTSKASDAGGNQSSKTKPASAVVIVAKKTVRR